MPVLRLFCIALKLGQGRTSDSCWDGSLPQRAALGVAATSVATSHRLAQTLLAAPFPTPATCHLLPHILPSLTVYRWAGKGAVARDAHAAAATKEDGTRAYSACGVSIYGGLPGGRLRCW
jgi:hypothetical protein